MELYCNTNLVTLILLKCSMLFLYDIVIYHVLVDDPKHIYYL